MGDEIYITQVAFALVKKYVIGLKYCYQEDFLEKIDHLLLKNEREGFFKSVVSKIDYCLSTVRL